MIDRAQQPPPAQSSDPREIRSSELLEHGHITVRTYTVVFIALMVLLVITVLAAQIPFGKWNLGPLGVLVTFLIAVVKAVLVVVYFMHIRYSTRLTRVFVVSGLLWLAILFVITLSDYLTRSWIPLSSGWTSESSIPRPPPPERVPVEQTPGQK